MLKLWMTALMSLALALSSESAAAQASKGRFLDPLDLRDDDGNGRDFTVLNQFRYVDPGDTTWIVPAGVKVNGASIPRFLWTIVGSPWTGRYRRASVVHDYFYTREKYGSDKIHRVFYDAMITDGVGQFQAGSMYYAVVRFNPRWEEYSFDPYACNREQARAGRTGRINCIPVPADSERASELMRKYKTMKQFSVEEDRVDFDQAAAAIQTTLMSPEEIEKLAIANHRKAKRTLVRQEDVQR